MFSLIIKLFISRYLFFAAPPEVELTASPNPVIIGETVALTCTITRGNPMSYSYTWRHNGSVVSPTSNGSTMSILTYDSTKTEDVGDYSCSVSNGILPDGGDNLTIITGGKLTHFANVIG